MSTETPNNTPEAPKPAPPADPPAQEIDWKAEARKWEQRAKDNSAAAARLEQLEESQKSEAQKQADALKKANDELAGYKHREQVATWANQIVTEDAFKGIPASALKGNTEEELRAHAELLKPLIIPSAPVIPGQERSPQRVSNDPMRQFTSNLFAKSAND